MASPPDPARRVANFKPSKRSPYGAFAEGREKEILAKLQEALVKVDLHPAAIADAYGTLSTQNGDAQDVFELFAKIASYAGQPADLCFAVQVLFMIGQASVLHSLGLLFPSYDPAESYARNVTGALVTRVEARPSVTNSPWTFVGEPIGFPIGVGASPLTDNAGRIRLLSDNGFNIFTYRTVRSQAVSSVEPPNWLYGSARSGDADFDTDDKPPLQLEAEGGRWIMPGESDISTVNFYGLPSVAPIKWREDLSIAVSNAQDGELIIASVVGENYELADTEDALISDFVRTASQAAAAGTRLIELNLSCPNMLSPEGDSRQPLSRDWDLSSQIVSAVREKLDSDVKLIVKIAWASDNTLAQLVQHIGKLVDAYTAINALPCIAKTANLQPSFGSATISGVGGRAIRSYALSAVRRLRDLRFELDLAYEIIGVGGVTDATSFKDLYLAGANVVQSVSGVFSNPLLAHDCVAALGEVLPDSSPAMSEEDRKEVSSAVLRLVAARGLVSQHSIAALLPIPVTATFDLLNAMVEDRDLLGSDAWSLESSYYSIA